MRRRKHINYHPQITEEYVIQWIENEIMYSYSDFKHDYTEKRFLLELRKNILNQVALDNLVPILPVIIDFNNVLRDALQEMYNRAHLVWENLKGKREYGDHIELVAVCYLDPIYPKLHPLQGEDRQELWDALSDSGWNPVYETGVTHSLRLSDETQEECFDTFIGMDYPSPNWNEGLDPELTKDLHLINAFHNLFDHTNYALTDFIYVREFKTQIRIEINK